LKSKTFLLLRLTDYRVPIGTILILIKPDNLDTKIVFRLVGPEIPLST